MPKLKLLILDAGVVITLHQLGIWRQVVERCDVHVSAVVAEVESLFHRDPGSDRDEYGAEIDIQPDIAAGAVARFEMSLRDVERFRQSFDKPYADGIHDGEAESLAYLFANPQHNWLISSGDAIVFKVLGNCGRGEQGISLEEILGSLGLSKKLDWQFTKEFREKNTRIGQQDRIQGRGKC
ncbi:MAG: hypothetical protein R3C56_37935 [Pirellulaceae bacterium]